MSNTIESDDNSEISLKNLKEDNKKLNMEIRKPAIESINSCILSLLIKKEYLADSHRKRDSFETTDTAILRPRTFDYDSNEIKKFDEFNKSLSDISEFDLEKEEDNNKSEFNSSDDDNDNDNDEEETIIIKSKRTFNNKEKDKEYEIELEKEYDDIIKVLNINKFF
jgi:virulence-associated protein VapD